MIVVKIWVTNNYHISFISMIVVNWQSFSIPTAFIGHIKADNDGDRHHKLGLPSHYANIKKEPSTIDKSAN